MPESGEVRRELFAERGFARPGWRGDNEQEFPADPSKTAVDRMPAPWSWSWWLSSFDVLDLFANAFQFGLHLDHMTGDFRIVGFRADRIDFPPDFLEQEIKCFAHRVCTVERLLKLYHM